MVKVSPFGPSTACVGSPLPPEWPDRIALANALIDARRALAAADRAIPLLAAFAGDSMDSECHGALMDWDWHQARLMPDPTSPPAPEPRPSSDCP